MLIIHTLMSKTIAAKPQFLHISQSYITFHPDGSIKDLGLKIIKHRLSYAEWDHTLQDWRYVIVPCHCAIYRRSTHTQAPMHTP